MKKYAIILCTVIFVLMSVFAFRGPIKPGIYGTIDPAEGARKVWAVSGTDSISAIPVAGKFSLDVKAGNWKLVVEAIAPYKNTAVDNILVQESQPTDAGVIKLATQ